MKKQHTKPNTVEDDFLAAIEAINENAMVLDKYDAAVRTCGEHEGILIAGLVVSREHNLYIQKTTKWFLAGAAIQLVLLAFNIFLTNNILSFITLAFTCIMLAFAFTMRGASNHFLRINKALKNTEVEWYHKVLDVEEQAKEATNKKGE